MTIVKDRPETINVTSQEFDRACSHKGCDDPAAVLMSLRHSKGGGCPNRGNFYCRRHYEKKIDEMANWLKAASRCNMCLRLTSGAVGDNVKVIWL